MSRTGDSTHVPVVCTVKHVTQKAVLIFAETVDGEEKDAWIPRSQIKDFDPSKCNADEEVELMIARWIAEQKDLY